MCMCMCVHSHAHGRAGVCACVHICTCNVWHVLAGMKEERCVCVVWIVVIYNLSGAQL